jgi:hypothetical protein
MALTAAMIVTGRTDEALVKSFYEKFLVGRR